MQRRKALQFLGTACTVGIAGCLGDDSGEDDSSPDGDSNAGDYDYGTTEQVVEEFFEAWENRDVQGVNEQIHEDGDIEPMAESAFHSADNVEVQVPQLQEAEFCADCSDGPHAVVKVTGTWSNGEAFEDRLHLERTDDGEWRITSSEILFVTAPQADILFEDGDGTLTVIHDGGDDVPADEIHVRGDGIIETGAWYELSPEFDEGDTVTAGDSVTLEVESSYTVSVVWDIGEKSETLAGKVEY